MGRTQADRESGSEAGGGRSRRARAWILALGGLLLVLLVLSSPFVLIRLASVRDPLLRLAQTRAGLGGDVRLRVEGVDRFDPFGVELRGVELEWRGPDAHWERVSRIGSLSADWSLAPLATGRIQVGTVRIDTLEVSLPAVDAYLLRPGLQAKREPSVLQRSWVQLVPPATIGAVVITQTRIIDRDGVLLLGGLRLTDLSSSNRGLAGMLARGDVALPRQGLSVALHDGRLTADPDGAARLEALTLESGTSRLQLEAAFDPRVAAYPLHVRVDLERLWVGDLERWIPPAVPHAPGDSLAGTIELRRGPPGVNGEIRLHGRLAGESLRALRVVGHAGSDTLRVSDLVLEADAVSLTGHGAYLRSHRAGTASLAWRDLDPQSAWLPEKLSIPLAPGISGEADLSFVLPPAGPPTFDGTALVEGLVWDRLSAERVHISGQLVPGRFVRAESLTVALGPGRITASGLWPLDDGSADVAARFEALDLSVVPEIARAGAWGNASGEVRLQGPVRDLTVEGVLSARPLGWREWRSDTLDADSLRLRLRSLEGGATLHLANLWRNDRPLARDLFIRATRTGAPIAVEARMTGPDLACDLAGRVDPRGSAELRQAHLWGRRLGDLDLEAPWHLRWSADSVAADTLRLVSPLGHFDLTGHGSRLNGAVAGELHASRVMLGDLSRWLGAADTLRGACAARVVVGGRLPDPTIDLDLACDHVEWGPLNLGVPHVLAAWRDSTLWVGPVTIEGPAVQLQVRDFRIPADRPLLALLKPDPDRGRISLADLPCAGRIEITRLEIAELTGLAEVLNLPVAGTVTGTGSQLVVGGETVPLRVIQVGEPSAGKVERSLGGLFHATLELGGTPRSPRVQLEGGLDRLSAAGSDVGDIRFAAEYADSMITVEQFELVHEGGTTWARGRYPMQLTLIPPALHLSDRAADLQAELNDLNLALVSGFTRYIPDASGRVSGTLTLSGPGSRPRLEGSVLLHEGGFRIPSRSERIHSAEGQFTLGPEGLTIRSLEARTGTHGTVSVTGTLRSPESFELNAHAENVRAFETGRYDGVADGDLNAYTMPDPEGGRPIPHLDGVVDVREFTLTQDLARKELFVPGTPIPWQIDLDVRAPGNVHLSQVNASAELGEGQLHIAYRWPYWNLSGSIQLLSGTYRLLNNAFTITDGTVEFRDSGAGLDLTVSADAETYVAVAGEGSAPAEEVTVTVHVEGKPETLEVTLSSQPSMSQEDILELLSVGRLTRTGGFEPGAQTQWILLNTMVDRIENNLLQQSQIFNRVILQPGTTGEEPLKMTLRPIVTPAFMVNYSQDLSVDPARELSVNYRLSRVLYLRAGVARDRQAAGGFNDEYNLDLKCRFEYR